MKKLFSIFIVLIFSLSAVNGGESVKIEDLFGIPITSWVFEGSDGINQYQFEWEYPKSVQSINADYGYYFSFQHPNIVEYTFATPITFQNGDVLITKVYRKGAFKIKNNNLTINFSEVIHRIPDTYGKLGEALPEKITITMEVVTDGRTELYLKQISGKNIFEKNDKYKRLKFVASILPLEQ